MLLPLTKHSASPIPRWNLFVFSLIKSAHIGNRKFKGEFVGFICCLSSRTQSLRTWVCCLLSTLRWWFRTGFWWRKWVSATYVARMRDSGKRHWLNHMSSELFSSKYLVPSRSIWIVEKVASLGKELIASWAFIINHGWPPWKLHSQSKTTRMSV